MSSFLQLSLEKNEIHTITNENRIIKQSKFGDFSFFVEYKDLSRSKTNAIRNKHTKRIKNAHGKIEEKTDETAVENDLFVEKIVNWNIKDSSGIDIPCTDENKLFISEHHKAFANLILLVIVNEETGAFNNMLDDDDNEKSIEDLQEDIKENADEEIKN